MNCVLVTGGAGYVGSHCCKALHAAGFHPVSFDNLSHGHRWAVQWGPLEVGDISDPLRLSEVIAYYKPVAVLHFAANAYVGESVAHPLKYYSNNVSGSISLLQVMQQHGVSKIVFSSTCATYGIPQSNPISEKHPQRPINPYGETKLAVEQLLKNLDYASNLKSVCLRYFNAAGADPDTEIGEAHYPETHLIPLILDVAMLRRSSIGIYGTDYHTPDGTCIRDYIHVADLANAHVQALRHLLDGGESLRLNLGNGSGFSVRQVIEAARRVTGKNITVEELARRPGDPPALVGDATEAFRTLGWTPIRSEIDQLISDAWRWHQKYTKNMGM